MFLNYAEIETPAIETICSHYYLPSRVMAVPCISIAIFCGFSCFTEATLLFFLDILTPSVISFLY